MLCTFSQLYKEPVWKYLYFLLARHRIQCAPAPSSLTQGANQHE